jgi:hypothetical protein
MCHVLLTTNPVNFEANLMSDARTPSANVHFSCLSSFGTSIARCINSILCSRPTKGGRNCNGLSLIGWKFWFFCWTGRAEKVRLCYSVNVRILTCLQHFRLLSCWFLLLKLSCQRATKAGWQIGKLAKWQIGKMANWQIGKMGIFTRYARCLEEVIVNSLT